MAVMANVSADAVNKLLHSTRVIDLHNIVVFIPSSFLFLFLLLFKMCTFFCFLLGKGGAGEIKST
jgi:hypothetical protein